MANIERNRFMLQNFYRSISKNVNNLDVMNVMIFEN